ncbi:MAG: nickel-responsive transcriptional regulator NikR [Candidatus Methanomethyliaceae archaeon]|nr:nickel-responsive transcriptional regulator NikR [Candidatus Methanomethyliaceae archaeon]MDW7970982.1 nickel-responsive transcriptional regulator NikR [Nitrososphaerota archaeon]
MVIVSISIPDELLEELNKMLSKEWYISRSEILRHALRKYIYEHKTLESIKGEVIGTLSVLYEKGEKATEKLQHEFGDIIIAFVHVHVDEKNCLEVMVIKGRVEKLKKLMDGLKASANVRQMSFSLMSILE